MSHLFFDNKMSLVFKKNGSSYDSLWRTDLSFANCSEEVSAIGLLPAETYNYYKSSVRLDSIQAVRKIRYSGLYDGITLDVTEKGYLELAFRINAGANPEDIRIYCAGSTVAVNLTGDLVVSCPLGSYEIPAIYAYQLIGGVRVSVAAEYSVAGNDISVVLGSYNSDAPVYVTNALLDNEFPPEYNDYWGTQWTTFLKDDIRNRPADVFTSGTDIYVTGGFKFDNFKTVSPSTAQVGYLNVYAVAFNVGLLQDYDIYVAKFDHNRQFAWLTIFGGLGEDVGMNVVATENFNGTNQIVYVTGLTSSSSQDFFAVASSVGETNFVNFKSEKYDQDPWDMFIAKIRAETGIIYWEVNQANCISGNWQHATYVSFLGGDFTYEVPTSMTIDPYNNVYIGGYTGVYDPNLPIDFIMTMPYVNHPTQGYYKRYDANQNSHNSREGFLIKIGHLNCNGTPTNNTFGFKDKIVWHTAIGGEEGSGQDGRDAVLDLFYDHPTENLFVLGVTSSEASTPIEAPCALNTGSLPPSAGVFPLVDPDLNTNTAYVEGERGKLDAYVMKFDGMDRLMWSTLLGGEENEMQTSIPIDYSSNLLWGYSPQDKIGGIAVDENGYIYVGGCTDSDGDKILSNHRAFPIVVLSGAVNVTSNEGNTDAFLARFTPDLSLNWSTMFGSPATDYIIDLDAKPGTDIYFCGNSIVESPDNLLNYPPYTIPLKAISGGYFKDEPTGTAEAFWGYMDQDAKWQYSTYYGSTQQWGSEYLNAIAIDETNNHAILVGSGNNKGYTTPAANTGFPIRYLAGAYNYSGLTAAIPPTEPNYLFIADYTIVCNLCQRNPGQTEEAKSLWVYPNPASGQLRLALPEGETLISCEVLDYLGRTVYASTSGNTLIALDRLPQGVYLLQARTDKGHYSTKFIKQ